MVAGCRFRIRPIVAFLNHGCQSSIQLSSCSLQTLDVAHHDTQFGSHFASGDHPPTVGISRGIALRAVV
jgi:hypothetical protein